ncbi:MAG: amino acid permease [Planctomycetes bacterium]|nr:amino acid permease [Planctomycetota bacterium]
MEDERSQVTTLPRVLGPLDACTVVVGSVIGSGIFLKPGIAAAELPNFGPIVCVWIFVGLVTLCGSLALAELAAMLPHAGGPYIYLREAYGKLPAFLWGWTEFWVIRTGSIGALSTATAIYLGQFAPLSRLHQEAVAVGLVLTLSAINIVSTRWVARVQNITTVLKLGFLGLIIIAPYALGSAHREYLQPLFPAQVDMSLWRGLGMAMVAVMWPYDGWINIAPVAEEIRDPHRNLPLAIILGMGVVISVYVAANVSYHLTLPHQEIAQSGAVVFDLFRALLGSEAARWVALGVMCSTFGAVNANVLTGPRIYLAMARDGLLPRAVHQVHSRYETPANAIVLQGVWATLLIVGTFHFSEAPKDAFNKLTDFVIFGGSVFYALAVAAVFVLRRRRPELKRPYRTWGYPVTPALYLLTFGGALVSLLLNSPGESLAGTMLIVAGVPFFVWMQRRTN